MSTTALTDAPRFLAGQNRIVAAANAREQRIFDVVFFNGPVASIKAKNYLRVLLAKCTDGELVADLRDFFNTLRVNGDRISAVEVSIAIRLQRG